MKNVTVTLEETTAQWVRVKAAEQGKSVSRYLGDLLEKQMTGEQAYEEAMQRFLTREPVQISGGKPYPKREELYDRSGLR